MNASLRLPAPVTIGNWLQQSRRVLQEAGIASARLDCLVFAEDKTGKDRSYLLAHPEMELVPDIIAALNRDVCRRANHEPLAYIRGFIEFYGRRFTVDKDVLIPRPETEELIELALHWAEPDAKIIDVGTGSGAIAITLAAELSQARVEACDISELALDIAAKNNRSLGTNVRFFVSDLLDQADEGYDLIAANLPYVAEGFEVSPDAHAEPSLALFAEDTGYELIERLIPQAAERIKPKGFLLLESDPWQQDRILKTAAIAGFHKVDARRFHLLLQKVKA